MTARAGLNCDVIPLELYFHAHHTPTIHARRQLGHAGDDEPAGGCVIPAGVGMASGDDQSSSLAQAAAGVVYGWRGRGQASDSGRGRRGAAGAVDAKK